MNENFSSLPGARKQPTTEEVMAYIKGSQTYRAPVSVGTDYFEMRDAPLSLCGIPVDQHSETGATSLTNKNEVKKLKAVAPLANPTTATSCDDNITWGSKPLAPASSEPLDKAAVAPLRSPNGEEEVKSTCDAHGEPEPAAETPTEGGIELVDPDFYKIRVDLFDNGEGGRRNRFTAKLSIQLHQDHDPADNQQVFANFYGRARDLKKAINDKGLWDSWYDLIYEYYEAAKAMDADFKIKPHIAILKEKAFVAGKVQYDSVLHTACLLYQEHGKEPYLLVGYGLWFEELFLDAQFEARKKNAPYKMGYFIDPKRAGLATVRTKSAMKVKTKVDFGR